MPKQYPTTNVSATLTAPSECKANWSRGEYDFYHLTKSVGLYLNVLVTIGTLEFEKKEIITRHSVAEFNNSTDGGTYGRGASITGTIYSIPFLDPDSEPPTGILSIDIDSTTGRVFSNQPCTAAVKVKHFEEMETYKYKPKITVKRNLAGSGIGQVKIEYGMLFAYNLAKECTAKIEAEARGVNTEPPIFYEMYRVISQALITEDGVFAGPIPEHNTAVKEKLLDEEKASLITEDVYEIGYLTNKGLEIETYSVPSRSKLDIIAQFYQGTQPEYVLKWNSIPTGNQELLDLWNEAAPGLAGRIRSRYPNIVEASN